MQYSKVLVVDDDAELQDLIALALKHEGWFVYEALTAQHAVRLMAQHRPQVVVLDVMLPDGNGLDLLNRWRLEYPETAIMMLSAKGEPQDRVHGLDLGADDYLTKPFVKDELVSRVRALLRRRRQVERQSTPQFAVHGLHLDRLLRQVVLNGQRVALTEAEFKLLEALAREPGATLSREALNAAMQLGAYRPQDRTVDTQIYRLRSKLQDTAPGCEWIVTVRGLGYALSAGELKELS
ncbi:MAG: response regulator transcription factor [Rhodoferax sp.]|uniref:response regulator transcription factor n=1 Tax=Rhodoferax sp. TaxID=50421 RepID=UPI003017AAB6